MKKLHLISILTLGLIALVSCGGSAEFTKADAVKYANEHYSLATVATKTATVKVDENKNGELNVHGEELPNDVLQFVTDSFGNVKEDLDINPNAILGVVGATSYLNEARINDLEDLMAEDQYNGKATYELNNDVMTITASTSIAFEDGSLLEGYDIGFAFDYKAIYNELGLPTSIYLEEAMTLIEIIKENSDHEQYIFAVSSSIHYDLEWK